MGDASRRARTVPVRASIMYAPYHSMSGFPLHSSQSHLKAVENRGILIEQTSLSAPARESPGGLGEMSGLDAHFLFGAEICPDPSSGSLQSRTSSAFHGTGMALN